LSDRKRKEQGIRQPKISLASGTPRWQTAAAIAVILIAYVALRLPGISVPLDRDEGAFGYMGQLINAGKLPYRDGVDHKPPVAFYINALALRFVPPTEQGVHIFLLLYNSLTLLCMFYLGKCYFRSLSAGLWCAFAFGVFSASPAIQGFTASTEMWMLLPIALSLLLAVLGAQRRRNSMLLVLSGVAGATACWTKQTAFTSILFVFVFVCLSSPVTEPGPAAPSLAARMRAVAYWMLGAAGVSVLLISYFYIHGIFGAFFYWSFLHNVSYTVGRTLSETLSAFQERLVEIIRGDFVILGAGIIAAVWLLIKKDRKAYFILGFLALSLLGTLPGFSYRHYFAQLAPAVGLAGGYGFFVLVEHFRKPDRRPVIAIACGLLALCVPVAMNRQYFFERNPNKICRTYFQYNPFPESKQVAAYVAESTSPSDKVFIVGSEPEILFYARRQSPSSFLMMYPLTSSYPRYKEFQETVWNDLQKAPPRFILKAANISSSFAPDGIADVAIFDRLDNLIRSNYVVDQVLLLTEFQGAWVSNGGAIPPKASGIYVCRRKD
jgi:hypothetical protein